VCTRLHRSLTLCTVPACRADLPPSKMLRGNLPPELRIGAAGDMGRILVAGEPGNDIVPEVAPVKVNEGACTFQRGHPAHVCTKCGGCMSSCFELGAAALTA
jgi:ferredoxin